MEHLTDQPQPVQLPVEIDKRPEAISLYKIAVMALAAVAVLAVLGGIALAIAGKPVPESMVALGGVALGALAGMVAPAQGGT